MALNPKAPGNRDTDCTATDGPGADRGGTQMNSTATSATANQNGDQPGCGDRVMPEHEAPERRKSAHTDSRSFSGSPLPGQRPNDELPRKNFQIPRKIRERKGLYQFLPPDSREFDDLVKTISSFYLDSASRGTFTYCKARLIHNELLEKEFVEKRREMKQEGRNEPELVESYCFLFPEKSKLQWICEKGLSVGHSRITTLGNPSSGVYLSKYSDLLQINPFEAGSFGDMIVFKVMRGRIKHIHENMPKNAIEPTPKFDCHLSKRANRVTSLLSYRAFEHTQQYFFEFAFEEIKARPRHVCPYAVVSFLYKGKEGATTPMSAHRFNTILPEGSRGKSCYTVWSGPLVIKGEELFPVCLRSSRPYLPFKLSEKLELNQGMQLEQVKRKIPSILFSSETYLASREVMRCGLWCSLFDIVEGKGKPGRGNLAALVNKLERDRLVLVKSLFDRGFLFLLSSAQMHDSKERWGKVERNLQALFIFQEPRIVAKYSTRMSEPEPLSMEPHSAILSPAEPLIPGIHYSMFKLRPNPGKDMSSGVERQSTDYLTRMESATVRPFILPDYKSNVDDRLNPLLTPTRSKYNMDAALRTYVHNSNNYMLPLTKAKDIIERIRNPVPVVEAAPVPDYSPVSDWGGSDRGSDRVEKPPVKVQPERAPPDKRPDKKKPGVAHSNGAQVQPKMQAEPSPGPKPPMTQTEYDEEKMRKLLKLIQLHKKTRVKEPGEEDDDDDEEEEEDVSCDVNSLKRKHEGDEPGATNKHQRKDSLSNGEPSQGSQEVAPADNLYSVMERIGYDSELKTHTKQGSAITETQGLLKILLATLNKAVAQGSKPKPDDAGSERTDSVTPNNDQRKPNELAAQTNYVEEDMDCSPGSPFSAGSPLEKAHTSNDLHWAASNSEDKEQLSSKLPEKLKSELKADIKPELKPEFKPDIKQEVKTEVEPENSYPKAKVPPVTLVKKTPAPPPVLAVVEELPAARPSISLDTILNQEVYSMTSDIKSLMQSHHISYTSKLPPRLPRRHCWQPNSSFSEFVVPYTGAVSVESHVKILSERISKLIPAPSEDSPSVPPVSTSDLTVPSATTNQSSAAAEPSSSTTSTATAAKLAPVNDKPSTKVKSEGHKGERVMMYSPTHATPDSPSACLDNQDASSGRGPGLLAGSLIGQLKPEVFSSLVEIFKDVTKNTVKFFIYSGDETEESTICKEIKEYLISLGNSESSPQTFLENSGSLDKLLIIIQNEHIAAHVHKIPALVSLKKLPLVSFAGVDSLDDVKNHTYNELFVSGGFMVSDEFVLNPDSITQDRLQGILKFLEEQSTPEHPWQWKVHCKSQKKLKELGRLNANAMGLLNLLNMYQKKHLVEFLPYHECDTVSRQAPDLDCLIKLQAQHTQQRHLIFLTERPFEMFLQYSRNGIVIASIDDVMNSFHSLIGSINHNELPTPPSTVVNDECVEEDMSIDSEDDGEAPGISEEQNQEGDMLVQPPLPDKEAFRPPLPDQLANPCKPPSLSDYSALKSVISQFKAVNQLGPADFDSLSPGGFPVNPHQSFLCPSAPWSSYTGTSSYNASPAYPASPSSSTQEADYRPLVSTTGAAPNTPAPVPAETLANLASLPLEVKPPPPPHLMMLGHTYRSDSTGAETAEGSPLTAPRPFSECVNTAQAAYTAGITSNVPVTLDRTLGPGEGMWGAPLCVDTSTELMGGSNLSCQGDRTPLNSDTPGPAVGVPAADTRGSSIHRPRMPPPPLHSGAGYSGFVPTRGPMDHGPIRGAMNPGAVGGFRGRGPAPGGHWPRPMRGGGGPGSYWGFQGGRGRGQNYYSDYSYSHNYAPE
ncbi:protein TASOR-like [Eucyclogobius newberryi]|uniref:protein TASOR-like n=1 Tax=Eucyclogobius newberryi TaxID=166745 RepID=UPI003B5B7274